MGEISGARNYRSIVPPSCWLRRESPYGIFNPITNESFPDATSVRPHSPNLRVALRNHRLRRRFLKKGQPRSIWDVEHNGRAHPSDAHGTNW